MSTMSTNLALAHLPEETWGQRLRRARGKRALEATAELVSLASPTSHTSLARLEQLDNPPEKGKLRSRAVLALLVYGYEPSDFGLSLNDLPRAVDVDRFVALMASPATLSESSHHSGVV